MQDFEIKYPVVSLFETFPHEKIDTVVLPTECELFRSHNSNYDWLFYDESDGGRFNGHIPDSLPDELTIFPFITFGGCYIAATPEGAISESTFRNIHMNEKKFIEYSWLQSRRITEIVIPDGVNIKLVDMTSQKTRTQLGVDTQIFNTPHYDVCFGWAQLIYANGYDGIKYRGRNFEHDCYVVFPTGKLHIDHGDSVGLLTSERFIPKVKAFADRIGVEVEGN